MTPHRTRPDLVLGLAASIACFVLYLCTLCPTVPVGDSGELVTAAATLGISHPTGFPLYMLLGRLIIAVLPGDPVVAMNVFSAASASIAVLGAFALAFRVLGSRWAALFVALMLGVSLSFWGEATASRVYTLSIALLVHTWLQIARWQGGAPKARLYAALLAGMGLAVHSQGVLGVCAVLGAALWKKDYRWLPRASLALLPGLALYAYLPLRASSQPALNWGNPSSPSRLLRYLSREQYWGKSWVDGPDRALAAAAHEFANISHELTWAGALLAAIGIVALIRTKRDWAILFVLTAIANVSLVVWHGSFNDLFFWHRYVLPTTVAACFAAGTAVALLPKKSQPLVLALPLLAVCLNYSKVDRSRDTLAYDYARALLEQLPPSASLVGYGDNILFPLLYAKHVEGIRPDVNLIPHGIDLPSQLAFDYGKDPVFFTHRGRAAGPLPLGPAGLTFSVGRQWERAVPTELIQAAGRMNLNHFLNRNIVAYLFMMLGENQIARGSDQARQSWRYASRVDCDNPRRQYNLALLFARQGWYQDAADALERALRVSSDLGDAQERLVRLRTLLGARPGYERAEVYSNRAREAFREGDRQAALTYAERAAIEQPHSPRRLMDWAAIAVSLGRWSEAADAYRSVMRLDPGNAAATEGYEQSLRRGLTTASRR